MIAAALQPGAIVPLIVLATLLGAALVGWMLWAVLGPSPWSEEAYAPVRRADREYTEAVIAYWSACKAEDADRN